jgi:hypothetical protein
MSRPLTQADYEARARAYHTASEALRGPKLPTESDVEFNNRHWVRVKMVNAELECSMNANVKRIIKKERQNG